ncbi:HNH endonuclease [Oceanobacillus halophilus]|uniref:HNH endonuclease n=1 Tax=Oceanobacillus halophilus TaxID=930130 RepID=A0A494ZZC9_9BACI|nr:HNH endonuclease signature motif containing protein [Oceanobacillus halophilus]RKQ32304.1 HNH endonuclease [Oceanobacillus halophilus]
MNYYLVFQNKSYKEERNGGYLWAPQKNHAGQSVHHWSDVGKVRKGDIIFNSYKGKMNSIIIAKEDARKHDRPLDLDELDLWEKQGWLVEAEYIDLPNPVVYKNYMEEILRLQGNKYAPFNRIGRGNTGYLFRVTDELADMLFGVVEGYNNVRREEVLTTNSQKEVIAEINNEIESREFLNDTEKELFVKSRIGQSIFKKKLIKLEKKCKLCGVTDERFLIASHIKPWNKSNNYERLDVNNGLLLCPNHDALFDKGYVTFNDNGDILISSSIDEPTCILLNIHNQIKLKINKKQMEYMKWHRKVIFKS